MSDFLNDLTSNLLYSFSTLYYISIQSLKLKLFFIYFFVLKHLIKKNLRRNYLKLLTSK